MATVPLNEDTPSKKVGITADLQLANSELTSTACLCPELSPICFILDTVGKVFLLGCCLLNPSRIQPFLPRVYSYFPPMVQLFLPRVQLFSSRVLPL